MIALKKDIINLIWLSKLKMLSIFIVFIIISACLSNNKNIEDKEFVNYYSGVVLESGNKTPIEGVSVQCIIGKNIHKVNTDKKGYFKINDESLTTLNIQENRKIIFSKNGYISDTTSTTQIAPTYQKYPVNHYFIYKKPDTLYMKKLEDREKLTFPELDYWQEK